MHPKPPADQSEINGVYLKVISVLMALGSLILIGLGTVEWFHFQKTISAGESIARTEQDVIALRNDFNNKVAALEGDGKTLADNQRNEREVLDSLRERVAKIEGRRPPPVQGQP